MEDREVAFWQMVGVTSIWTDENADQLTAFPDIVQAGSDLKVLHGESTDLIEAIDPSAHGYVAAKNTSKSLLLESIMPVLLREQAYALKIKDEVLQNRFKYSPSELEYMPEAGLSLIADDIYTYANANKTVLEPLGLTVAHLSDLHAKLADYNEKLPKAPKYLGDKQAARLTLKNNKAAVYIIFNETMEPQMNIVKLTNPELYITFRTARKIKNMPTRSRNGKEEPEVSTKGGISLTAYRHSTGDPAVGASMQIEGDPIVMLTDEEGQAYRDDLNPRMCVILVKMDGCVDLVKPDVEIKAGEITDITLDLDDAES